MQTNINPIRSKAIEILNKLTDNEIDIQYGSALKDSKGGCSIMRTKSGKLFPRFVRDISINDEFASQVFYRHSLKRLCGVLNVYAQTTPDLIQKTRAEEYLNMYKNIENVYSNKKDDESFDMLVERTVQIMFSSITFSKEYHETIPFRYYRPIEVTSILDIKKLPEINAKRLEMASNRIKNYTMKKDV